MILLKYHTYKILREKEKKIKLNCKIKILFREHKAFNQISLEKDIQNTNKLIFMKHTRKEMLIFKHVICIFPLTYISLTKFERSAFDLSISFLRLNIT